MADPLRAEVERMAALRKRAAKAGPRIAYAPGEFGTTDAYVDERDVAFYVAAMELVKKLEALRSPAPSSPPEPEGGGRPSLSEARQIASRCWCRPETSSLVMDFRLAEAFARVLAFGEPAPEEAATGTRGPTP